MVHLRAQNSAADIAAASDPVSQTAELANLLEQFLTQTGVVGAEKAGLEKSLQNVDVSGGDSEGILAAVSSYLSSTSTVTEGEKFDALAQQGQGKQVVDSLLPSLGIVPKKRGMGDVGDSVTSSENKLLEAKAGQEVPAVEIVDARDFKLGVPLSEGLKAVRDLAEFEELEAKL